LVFAPRAAGRVRPSHPAQTSAKGRPGAGYGDAGSGTKPPLSAAKSRANAIEGSARFGPMRCRPAGRLSPVTPIGAVVADRFDWLARPATNTCGALGTDLPWSLSGFTGRSLAAPEHLQLNKETRRARLAAMPSPLSGSTRRVSPICPHRPHRSWRHRRRSTSSQLAGTRAFSEVSSVPSHLPPSCSRAHTWAGRPWPQGCMPTRRSRTASRCRRHLSGQQRLTRACNRSAAFDGNPASRPCARQAALKQPGHLNRPPELASAKRSQIKQILDNGDPASPPRQRAETHR
jgi:hypothetical protein